EPLGDWGEGAVQLVEIPTNDEIHDNVVAYWLPYAAAQSGAERSFNYRLHWVKEEPYPPDAVGRVRHTRIGIGGIPGRLRPKNTRKFVIDFSGGPLKELEQRYDVTTVVSASRGTIDNAVALKVVGTPRWRASFDLSSEGEEPVDLRCYLRLEDRTLTETWLYQYVSGYE
ncbi:MAG: glucan biosynthesis protein, partial [Gammaproteobacteria bacterium]